MAIELVGITALGDNRYRLDFNDEGASVSFVLLRRPRTGGVVMTREFYDHFYGRSSGREAIGALGMFAEGEEVTFPVKVRKDGFKGMGG